MSELTVVDWELDTVVATVYDDGSYDAKTQLARYVLGRLVGDDGAVPWRYAEAGPDDETREATRDVHPGDEGYLYAVADALPSPLEPRDLQGIEEPPVVEGADGDEASK